MRIVRNRPFWLSLGLVLLAGSLSMTSCKDDKPAQEPEVNTNSMSGWTAGSPNIDGRPEYLDSPFVAAGDRVYMVGHQNGSFPDLGWHIKGEMSGIWNHPIKLMDGFDIVLQDGNKATRLLNADGFTNFPYANRHRFNWEEANLRVDRWNFVPDGQQGMFVQLVIDNPGAARTLQMNLIGHSDLRPTWLGERSEMIDGQDSASFWDEELAWQICTT